MGKKKKKFIFKNNQGVAYSVHFGTPWKLEKGKGGRKRKREKMDGWCYPPTDKTPKIIINKNLGKRRMLNVIIEELSHAFFWDLKEKEVRPFATTLRNLLYEIGWREVNQIE